MPFYTLSPRRALVNAMQAKHFDIAKLLLDRGADIKSRGGLGETLLHMASQHGQLDLVVLLVDRGLDIEAPDNDKQTALHVAAANGHLDVVKHLVVKGGTPKQKDRLGRLPLHLACYHGHLSIVQVLVDWGAQVETTDFRGKRPLHHAAEQGHLAVVQHLVKQGASIEAKTKLGEKPIQLAIENSEVFLFLAHRQIKQMSKELQRLNSLPVMGSKSNNSSLDFWYQPGTVKISHQVNSIKRMIASNPFWQLQKKATIRSIAAHKGQTSCIKTCSSSLGF